MLYQLQSKRNSTGRTATIQHGGNRKPNSTNVTRAKIWINHHNKAKKKSLKFAPLLAAIKIVGPFRYKVEK